MPRLPGMDLGRGWAVDPEGGIRTFKRHSSDFPKLGMQDRCCLREAEPLSSPTYQYTKGIQMRDKYLRPHDITQPSLCCPAPAGSSQFLIWVLIGFHLEICMLIYEDHGQPWGWGGGTRQSPRAHR
jgi:hypothetical protein